MSLQQSVMHKLQFILKSQKKLLTRSPPFLFVPERIFQEKQSKSHLSCEREKDQIFRNKTY